jgi:hypothetical protein
MFLIYHFLPKISPKNRPKRLTFCGKHANLSYKISFFQNAEKSLISADFPACNRVNFLLKFLHEKEIFHNVYGFSGHIFFVVIGGDIVVSKSIIWHNGPGCFLRCYILFGIVGSLFGGVAGQFTPR